MRRPRARWLAVAVVCMFSAGTTVGLADSWIGKQVVTSSLHVYPRIGTQTVGAGRAFRVYRVERVQGEWLWVVSGDVRGWIRCREAIPYENALSICTEQIRTRATAAVYTLRGYIWLEKKQYELAMADFSAAIRLAPKSADAHAGRGDARLARTMGWVKDLQRRRRSRMVVNDNDPDDLALVSRLQSEADSMIADYQKVLSLDPHNVRAYLNSGGAWLLNGEPDRAVACLDEAVRLAPTSSPAYFARSRALDAINRETESLADLDTALRLDPGNCEALEARMNLDDSTGQYDRLIADASALIELDPQNTDAYILRGNAWSKKGQCAKASHDFEAALRIEPGNEVAGFNLRGLIRKTSAKPE